jgi:sarcosine oxidase gamma subunit
LRKGFVDVFGGVVDGIRVNGPGANDPLSAGCSDELRRITVGHAASYPGVVANVARIHNRMARKQNIMPRRCSHT